MILTSKDLNMMKVVVYSILFYFHLVKFIRSECCDDNCKENGDILDCNNVCQHYKLCNINKWVKFLKFENNSLHAKPYQWLPYSSTIQELYLGHNGLTNLVPESIFRNYPILKKLDLTGNKFHLATFDSPVKHSLEEILNLEAHCVNDAVFTKFPKLKRIEIKVNQNTLCDKFSNNTIREIKLELLNTVKINHNDLKFLQSTRKIELVIPKVQKIDRHDLIQFFNVHELILDAPLLDDIHVSSLISMSALVKIIIRAPKLKYFSPDLFKNVFLPHKIEHMEFCPIAGIPHDVLMSQKSVKTFKLCNFDDDLKLGLPVDQNFDEIYFANGRYNIYNERRWSSTFYLTQNGEIVDPSKLKVNTNTLRIINMRIPNFDWGKFFNKSAIKVLDLRQNRIKDINGVYLKGFTNLIDLNMASNEMDHVSNDAIEQTNNNLQYLNLTNNNIEVIDLSGYFTGYLRSLDLSNNHIHTIKPDVKGVKISKMNLNNNRITNIDNLFNGRQSIRSLLLDNNRITKIPITVSKTLSRVFLRNNPLDCSCEAIGHITNLKDDLLKNGQIYMIKSLSLATCEKNDNGTKNLMKEANLCANVTEIPEVDTEFRVIDTGSKDIFSPYTGVTAQNIGKVSSGNDIITASVLVPLPQQVIPPAISLRPYSIKCKLRSRNAQNVTLSDNFCNSYLPDARERLRETRFMKAHIQKLVKNVNLLLFDDNLQEDNSRKKRFIFSGFQAVSSLIMNFAKTYNSYLTNKQTKAMGKAIEILQLKALTNHEDILTVQKDLAMYKVINLNRYNDIIYAIKKLENHTNNIITTSLRTLSRNQEILRDQIHKSNWEMFTIQKIELTIANSIRQFSDLVNVWTHFTDMATDIKKGNLHPFICSATLLREILDKAKELISVEKPDFKLVIENEQSYYSMNNIAFTASKELNALIVQIPILLSLKELHTLDLFRLNAIAMPLKDNQRTKISLKNQYLAVYESFYQLFTSEEFNLCQSHLNGKIYICPFDLMVRNKQTKSCESAIFFNNDLSDIYELCDIHILPENSHRESEMLQFNNQIVLSGVHNPVEWKCDNQINNKIEISEQDLFIIDRESLCNCELKTKEFFIPKRSCINQEHSNKLHFVANSLAFFGLRKKLYMNVTNDYLLELHDNPINITYPSLNLSNLEIGESLAASQDDVELDFKSVLETRKLIDNQPKIKLEDKLNNIKYLFMGKLKILGIILVLAISGTLALIMLVFVCKRQIDLRKLLFALVNFIPTAEASDGKLIALNDWSEILISTAIMFVCVIILQIMHVICRKAIFVVKHAVPNLHIPKALQKQPKAKLYLTLRTYNDRLHIPLCNILASPDNIKLANSFDVLDIKVVREYLRYFVIIEWAADKCSLLIENLTVDLPSKINLNFFKAKEIEQFQLIDSIATLTLIDINNIAHQIASQVFVPKGFIVQHDNKEAELSFKQKKALLLRKRNNTSPVPTLSTKL